MSDPRSRRRQKTPLGQAIILIIDDNPASRVELARVVSEIGHQAVMAESPFDGLRLAREIEPSLVMVDVEMPDLDGYKIAAAIKALPRFVPVMLFTSHSDLEAKRRGQAAGADDFLSKPVVPLELQIRIAAMLRIKSLTDALAAANQRLAELADLDGLTGVANRRRFDQLFAAEHERAERYQRPLSLALLDIDHFKRVNDTHGHPIGDQVLKQVATMLADTLRKSDYLARLGGEEFGVIAPEVGIAGGLALGERLRRSIETLAIPTDAGAVSVTISIGVVAWDGVAPIDCQGMLKQADDALYQAKEKGRNRSVLAVVRSGGE